MTDEQVDKYIGKPFTDDKGNYVRIVNGKHVIQIDESDPAAIHQNLLINRSRVIRAFRFGNLVTSTR